jgi:hypothetical protein
MIKRLLTRYWFTWANIVLGIVCATVFQFIKTDKDGNATEFLIAFITMSIALLSWWLEFREMELLTESQLLSYLENQKIHEDLTVVGKNKLLEMNNIKSEIKEKCYSLTYPQMEKYTSDVIKELSEGRAGLKQYYAIHNVNTHYFREVWEYRETAEALRDEFVEAQKYFLNNGGRIVRIFIFDPIYFRINKQSCFKVLDDHDKYYYGTRHPIETLACLYDPQRDEHITYDYTIIGSKVSFEWKRRLDNNGYGNGLCYVTKSAQTPKFSADFERIKQKAKSKTEFFRIHGYVASPLS